jgi:hypothetical protein
VKDFDRSKTVNAQIRLKQSMEIPGWLFTVSVIALAIAALSALVIIFDIVTGHSQHMWIMNLVWPITALWAGPIALWAYFRIGRLSTHQAMRETKEHGAEPPSKNKPFSVDVALSATHCGAGCFLGDIVAEWIVFFVPLVLFGQKVFGAWALDFVFAFLFGIAFQYFTIKPMKNLSVGKGLIAALKADTFSLTSWQLGMYGWMAIVIFVLFGEIPKTNPTFWFMMQIAMLAGFMTSYPANWWLIKSGIKERM